jgi:hypothetical protein
MADPPPNPDDLASKGPPAVSVSPLRQNLATGLLFYALTSSPVVLTILCLYFNAGGQGNWAEWFGRWDGIGFARVARDGYFYTPHNDPEDASTLMYFPGYPLAGRLLVVSGLSAELALLIVSQLCTAAAFVVLAAYVQVRFPEADANYRGRVLLALGLLPFTFAFRMALSEGPFFLLLISTFYAMQRQVSAGLIALLIGLATSIRPVGVSLLVPLWIFLWQQTPGWRPFLVRACVWTPVACWGAAAFVLYAAWEYGEPFVYVRVQAGFQFPGTDQDNKWLSLLTLKPFWGHFVSSARCYWGNYTQGDSPLLDLYVGNPIWFGSAIVVVAVGAVKRWINGSEVLLSAGLFAIPYLSVAHSYCMCSHARYASVVFPVYLVVGRLTGRISRPLAVALMLASLSLLLVYAGRVALNYPVHF